MLIVAIESPLVVSDEELRQYAGRYSKAELLRQNLVYARMCVLSSFLRGESPVDTALLFAEVWRDGDEQLRKAAERAALEVHHRVGAVALYVDLGTTANMRVAQDHARLVGTDIERRSIMPAGVKDAREALATRELVGFPELVAMNAGARASAAERGTRA